uniref:Ovule protein n=1 Tax=Steinernema glaseri TaxID=37863 RepID=A0A1I7YAY7_9BILA
MMLDFCSQRNEEGSETPSVKNTKQMCGYYSMNMRRVQLVGTILQSVCGSMKKRRNLTFMCSQRNAMQS